MLNKLFLVLFIFGLSLAAFLLLANHNGLALRVLNYVFFLGILTLFLYLIDLMKVRK